jgi:hypothetical protein
MRKDLVFCPAAPICDKHFDCGVVVIIPLLQYKDTLFVQKKEKKYKDT